MGTNNQIWNLTVEYSQAQMCLQINAIQSIKALSEGLSLRQDLARRVSNLIRLQLLQNISQQCKPL